MTSAAQEAAAQGARAAQEAAAQGARAAQEAAAQGARAAQEAAARKEPATQEAPAAVGRGGAPLLAVEELHVGFGRGARAVHAVRGISFTVGHGEIFALVGESGSGKSVTARTMVGLAGPGATVHARRLDLAGTDLTELDRAGWRRLRGARVGLVLQDALSALDPLRRVGQEVAEAAARGGTGRDGRRRAGPGRPRPRPDSPRRDRHGDSRYRDERVLELLSEAGIPDPAVRARQYPHQLSGGLRQRALIATALAGSPELLIADEPTTALDVTVQAQVLDLLGELRAAGRAVLLISHDLAVVSRLADRVAVMRAGVLVETGPTAEVLNQPAHEYTRALLAAVPSARTRGSRLSAPPAEATRSAVPAQPLPEATRRKASADATRPEAPAETTLPEAPAETTGREAPALPAADGAPAAVPAPPRRPPAPDPVLVADEVTKRFRTPRGDWRDAVAGVSLALRAEETVGLVGESGSGKSTLARILLGLTEPDSGTVRFDGQPWSGVRESARRPLRREIQAVFQDPLGSFDPRATVAGLLGEALGVAGVPRGRRRAELERRLEQVGLSGAVARRRPVELSGGQRQRVAIARALATGPRVLICDEPVSALDVSVQAQILDLLADLRRELGMAMVFVSHDLGVVHHVSDRVLVMHAGRVVESGEVTDVFTAPRHPYTQALLASVPRLAPTGPAGAAGA